MATCWVMPEAPSGRLPGLVRLAIDGAAEAHEVDAGMGEEALVLGGDEGLQDALGHGGDRHEDALFLGVLGEQPAVGGVEPRHGGGLVVGELLVVGQAVAEMPEQAGRRCRCPRSGWPGAKARPILMRLSTVTVLAKAGRELCLFLGTCARVQRRP